MSQPPAGTRPTGITILAILAGIAGVLGLLGGLALFGIGAAIGGAVGGVGGAAFGTIFGLGLIALSIAYLAFAYGAWGLKPWAWTLGVASQIIGLVLTLLQIVTGNQSITGAIIGIALNLIILYYLDTPDVRRAFGRNPTSWFGSLSNRSK
jgi:hypothetical protein